MLDKARNETFTPINAAYSDVFRPGQLTLGLVLPLEAYGVGSGPTMADHIEAAQLAEALGFASLWLRDVPFNVPSFGDPGQIYDPFVYLGALATATEQIAIGTSSIILPLRHPAHVAKAAATVDVLSGGRLLMGVASGDRPEEFPAMAQTYDDRGERFRESIAYLRAAGTDFPRHTGVHGTLSGSIDLLPKPTGARLPLLITGGSQQTPDWVARNGDGWMTYPRDVASQARVVAEYRQRVLEAEQPEKPVMQSLYVDLTPECNTQPSAIHLGFRSGTDFLCSYLEQIEALGINHVALNLRFNRMPINETLERLARDVLPAFS